MTDHDPRAAHAAHVTREAAEADLIEQALDADSHDAEGDLHTDLPVEVDPADAVDQALPVPNPDDDGYPGYPGVDDDPAP